MFTNCGENERADKAQVLSHVFATLTAHATLIAALVSTLATAGVKLSSFLGIYSTVLIAISLIITLTGLMTLFFSKFWSRQYGQLDVLKDFTIGSDMVVVCSVICGASIAFSNKDLIPGTLLGNLGIASIATSACVILSVFLLVCAVFLYRQTPKQERVRFSLGAAWNAANSILTIAGGGAAVLLSLQVESLSDYMWLAFAVAVGALACCKMGTALRCCCTAQQYSEECHNHEPLLL